MFFKDVYDKNDFTVIITENGFDDQLIEYILNNQVDVLLSLNFSHNHFKQSLKRTNFVSYSDESMPLSRESLAQLKSLVFKKQKIIFKYDMNKVTNKIKTTTS